MVLRSYHRRPSCSASPQGLLGVTRPCSRHPQTRRYPFSQGSIVRRSPHRPGNALHEIGRRRHGLSPDKIFGPGNQSVTATKTLVQSDTWMSLGSHYTIGHR